MGILDPDVKLHAVLDLDIDILSVGVSHIDSVVCEKVCLTE
jgi:hypothetical protein